MSTPFVIPANRTLRTGDWLFEPDAEAGTQAVRDTCAAKILEDEIFFQFGELPQRMQLSFMKALRAGDTEANDQEVGRIIRAAFKRAVDESVEMYVDRLKSEASMKGDE
jgi:hypothetical protein